MEWINFRHLYSFWMVSQTRNFTAAANQMLVAQSAVSDQVAQLEDYLGEKLFLRSTRKIDLTDAGRQLFNYADVIFKTSKDINTIIKDRVLPNEAKKISIGIVGGASRNFLFRLFEEYINLSPETTINVQTGSFNELNNSLKKFELDLIITLELPKKKDLDDFNYQKIASSPLVLAGDKRLISSLKRKSRKSPLDIYKFSHPYETEIVEKFIQPLTKVETTVRLTTDDIPLLRFFANKKNTLSIIPQIGVWEDIHEGHLSYIELKKCPEVPIYGVFTKKSIHQKSVESLLETARVLRL
ncbi:MAG: LysR family transcriptional regulator [Deltaproteobacteria bacterium]|nr:MAG: LysR family transcriptional regulator [Deltaproteobacteria bacterium]